MSGRRRPAAHQFPGVLSRSASRGRDQGGSSASGKAHCAWNGTTTSSIVPPAVVPRTTRARGTPTGSGSVNSYVQVKGGSGWARRLPVRLPVGVTTVAAGSITVVEVLVPEAWKGDGHTTVLGVGKPTKIVRTPFATACTANGTANSTCELPTDFFIRFLIVVCSVASLIRSLPKVVITLSRGVQLSRYGTMPSLGSRKLPVAPAG